MKLNFADQKEIQVEIEYKKVKNLSMRILLDGTVKITAPYHLPEERILEFIKSKQNWIIKHTELQKTRREHLAMKTLKGPMVQLLGKKYYVVLKQGNNEGFELNQDVMTLTVKDESRAVSVFEKHAKGMLEEILNQKRIALDLVMDDYRLAHPEISVRKMKGKWGSCTPSKAKIVMNFMLVHMPVQCIEYVLIHEYMHMICPNHSKRFYELIEKHMPDYRSWKKVLNEE